MITRSKSDIILFLLTVVNSLSHLLFERKQTGKYKQHEILGKEVAFISLNAFQHLFKPQAMCSIS